MIGQKPVSRIILFGWAVFRKTCLKRGGYSNEIRGVALWKAKHAGLSHRVNEPPWR